MITLFGAPGAGKTLQGQLMARKYGWEWVSYRDLLLSLHDKDISYALDHGLFIDDDKATKLMAAVFRQLHDTFPETTEPYQAKQIILDGFPADYRQLKWMVDTKEIKHLNGAIILRVPRGELWRRLVERKRVDDTRATIERRQDTYDRNITGMIKTLNQQGIKTYEVNGDNSPEDVLSRIDEILAAWQLVPKKQFESIRAITNLTAQQLR